MNAFFISYQLKSLLDLLPNMKSFNKQSFCLAKGCHRQNVGNSIAFATQITALHRSNVFDQTISPWLDIRHVKFFRAAISCRQSSDPFLLNNCKFSSEFLYLISKLVDENKDLHRLNGTILVDNIISCFILFFTLYYMTGMKKFLFD